MHYLVVFLDLYVYCRTLQVRVSLVNRIILVDNKL